MMTTKIHGEKFRDVLRLSHEAGEIDHRIAKMGVVLNRGVQHNHVNQFIEMPGYEYPVIS